MFTCFDRCLGLWGLVAGFRFYFVMSVVLLFVIICVRFGVINCLICLRNACRFGWLVLALYWLVDLVI